MIDLIHPFVLNGKRYTRLDRDFLQLLVLYGRHNVVAALDQLGQTPDDFQPTTLRHCCEELEVVRY